MDPDSLFRTILTRSIEKTRLHGQYYTTFGILGTLYYIIPYFIWSHNSDIEYQTLFLRIFACILCFYLVIFHQNKTEEALKHLARHSKNRDKKKILTKNEVNTFLTEKIHSGHLPLYWHITLCYCLPLMSTYNLLDSSLETTWVVNSSLSILILVLLVDWFSFIIIMFSGILGGFLLFILTTGNLNILYAQTNYFLVIYVHFFSIIIGCFFLYQKEIMVNHIKCANEELQNFNVMLDELVKKRTEFLNKTLQYKTEFLNNISHEIRTPLQGVLGLSSTLVEHWDKYSNQDREEQVGIIAQSGDRLMSLVSNLLDISKFEAGKMLFNFTKHDIVKIINDVITELRPLCYDKQIEISFIYPKNIKEFIIELDLYRIEQVIRNILSNAIKYSECDITLILSLADQYGNKSIEDIPVSTILVEVKDKGIGVPENELQAIFFPFLQSSRTYKKAGGTGLGLSLSAEIIHAHHGKIWAYNNPGEQGSTFCFSIPLAQSNISSRVVLNNKTTLHQNTFNEKKEKYNILFVDDEKLCLLSGRVILESAGFNVTTASSGIEALEYIEKQQFDLILLDLMMPDLYGTEILLKIKSMPAFSNIPIILQSGASDQTEISKAMSLGASSYIVKPYSKDELISRIIKILGIKL